MDSQKQLARWLPCSAAEQTPDAASPSHSPRAPSLGTCAYQEGFAPNWPTGAHRVPDNHSGKVQSPGLLPLKQCACTSELKSRLETLLALTLFRCSDFVLLLQTKRAALGTPVPGSRLREGGGGVNPSVPGMVGEEEEKWGCLPTEGKSSLWEEHQELARCQSAIPGAVAAPSTPKGRVEGVVSSPTGPLVTFRGRSKLLQSPHT